MKHYLCIFAVFFALLVFSCGEVSGGFNLGGGEGYDADCDGKFYKSLEQFCFNNEIYSLCGGKEYDIAKEFCHSDGSVNIRCNGDMYNPGSYFCFDSKIYPKCGVGESAQIYNPKELFCYENILDTLCNGVKFDPKSYFCSHEDYKVHLFCDGKRYNPDLEICSIKNSSIYKICPSGNFSSSISTCCPNSNCTEYQLCGDADEYNVADQFCYEEKTYDKCGGLTYDPTKKICRYEKLNELCRVKVGVDDFGRPQFDDFPYDPETQKCTDNGVEDKPAPPKCPKLQDNEFCCFGKVYKKNDDYFCYKDELYPICIANTLLKPGDPLYRPRPTYNGGDTYQYKPIDEGCYEGKLYPRCSRDDVVGSCVNKATVKRCKQLGSGEETYAIDPLPGMTCDEKTGAITGKSNSGIPIAQIGTQVWMRENLNSALQDWATAMKIDASYNALLYIFPSDRPWQGPCPAGFYLPTDVDWEKLRVYAGGTFIAGNRLKDTNGWSDNGNGLNAYGFNALPHGYGNGVNQGPSEVGTRAMWWSVTQAANVENASYWTIISPDTEFRTHNQNKALNKAHIRCLHY